MLPSEQGDLFELDASDPRVVEWLSKLRTMPDDTMPDDEERERIVRDLWQRCWSCDNNRRA